MKIWVLGRNYPLPENGMQGSFELEQAKMLARGGNEVHYLACSLHPVKKIKKGGMQSWNDEGVEVSVLSAFFAPRVYPLYFIKQRNKKWKKLFDEVSGKSGLPDVIHIHYPSMLMIADTLKAYHEKGVRIIATEHWSKVLNKRLDAIERREYKKYKDILDVLICVGKPLKNAVRDLTGIEGIVVPNVVNALFRPSIKKHEGFRFVAVGRLVKLKQFDKIIEAFSECFAGEDNITLSIIGDGEQMDSLQKTIISRKMEKQINVLGRKDRETTAEIVSNSDSLVSYSKYETFGVPIIEAWACGLTAITTNTAAVMEDFDERLGIEISCDDFEGLKKALKHLYTHMNDYDKSFISNFAKTHYSEEVIRERLMEIYKGE